jgi:hypothetical protein
MIPPGATQSTIYGRVARLLSSNRLYRYPDELGVLGNDSSRSTNLAPGSIRASSDETVVAGVDTDLEANLATNAGNKKSQKMAGGEHSGVISWNGVDDPENPQNWS